MKSIRKLLAIAFVVFLIATMAMCLTVPANAQVWKTWTIVFRFKDNAGAPPCRLYLTIIADTEGQAAIDANKFLYEQLQPGPYGNLIYMEAQRKE